MIVSVFIAGQSRQPTNRATFCRSRSRIGRTFLIVRRHGLFREAIGEAFACPVVERVLDQAILQRVEADDRDAPTGAHQPGQRSEQGFEDAKLVVDGDAQRLEGSRGRINALSPAPWAVCGSADLGQLPCSIDR